MRQWGAADGIKLGTFAPTARAMQIDNPNQTGDCNDECRNNGGSMAS